MSTCLVPDCPGSENVRAFLGGEWPFQALRNVPLRDEIFALELLPEKLPIIFQQDVHSFLIGEHWTGSIKGVANAAAITLGTGLGFGLMRNSEILDNGRGGPHAVIFNLPFEDGILEDRISRRGIISQYCKYTGELEKNIDVHDIALRARNEQDIPAFKKKLRDEGLTTNVVPGTNIEFSSLIGAAKAVIHSQA